jgi:hemoglobin
MNEKRDIESRADIELLLTAFYKKAFKDELISHFFIEVVPLDLELHLPLIADFWESVLFNTHGYRKNVMGIHLHINRLSPVKKQHLDRWVKLFTETADEYFEGNRTELAKQRAVSIAGLMDIKINHPNPLRK